MWVVPKSGRLPHPTKRPWLEEPGIRDEKGSHLGLGFRVYRRVLRLP